MFVSFDIFLFGKCLFDLRCGGWKEGSGSLGCLQYSPDSVVTPRDSCVRSKGIDYSDCAARVIWSAPGTFLWHDGLGLGVLSLFGGQKTLVYWVDGVKVSG